MIAISGLLRLPKPDYQYLRVAEPVRSLMVFAPGKSAFAIVAKYVAPTITPMTRSVGSPMLLLFWLM